MFVIIATLRTADTEEKIRLAAKTAVKKLGRYKTIDSSFKITKQHIFGGALSVRSCGATINDEFIKHPIILWRDERKENKNES